MTNNIIPEVTSNIPEFQLTSTIYAFLKMLDTIWKTTVDDVNAETRFKAHSLYNEIYRKHKDILLDDFIWPITLEPTYHVIKDYLIALEDDDLIANAEAFLKCDHNKY